MPDAGLGPFGKDDRDPWDGRLGGRQARRQGHRIVEVAGGGAGVGQSAFHGAYCDVGCRGAGGIKPIAREAGQDRAAAKRLVGRLRGAGGEPVGVGDAGAGLRAFAAAERKRHRPASQRRGAVFGEDGGQMGADPVDQGGIAAIGERGLLVGDRQRDPERRRLELVAAGEADGQRGIPGGRVRRQHAGGIARCPGGRAA